MYLYIIFEHNYIKAMHIRPKVQHYGHNTAWGFYTFYYYDSGEVWSIFVGV